MCNTIIRDFKYIGSQYDIHFGIYSTIIKYEGEVILDRDPVNFGIGEVILFIKKDELERKLNKILK